MTQNEINGLVEQFLNKNTVTKVPQSKLKKDNQPTFGRRSTKRNFSIKN